jgi:hypothetical protein
MRASRAHRLRGHENMMLRRISGRKREEGIENWRKIRIELYILCSKTNVIKIIKSNRIGGRSFITCTLLQV